MFMEQQLLIVQQFYSEKFYLITCFIEKNFSDRNVFLTQLLRELRVFSQNEVSDERCEYCERNYIWYARDVLTFLPIFSIENRLGFTVN